MKESRSMNNTELHTEVRTTFRTFLKSAFDKGDYATDDVIAFVLPLFEELLSFHELNQVASFENEDSLFITENRLDIDERLSHNKKENLSKVKNLFKEFRSSNFIITGKEKFETEVEVGSVSRENLLVHWNVNEPLTLPAYIRGYNCFEIILDHHDVQTDIFCLGLILGSMSLSLDLYDEEDLKTFVEYRRNPVQYNERIHPTISSLITEMTELDRTKRTQDLYDVIYRLRHYREYDPLRETDLSSIPGWINKEIRERNHFILNKLRNRLFDTSRRNRLLYYKPNARFVNLTVSSVPMVLHYQSIRPDLLFTWNEDIAGKVKGMNEIVLNKYLRFEDHAYLPSSLDKIRVESQRAVQEYGFSQLKLVVAFLNWHNLKENMTERIQSPLLLIPVELKKSKRLKEDHYSIRILDNTAEVNPVVANQLRELYGIKLPDFVDLEEMELDKFYSLLKSQIDSANQGIQLHYVDKPRIKLIHSVAKQTLSNYRKRLRRSGNKLDSYKNIAYSYQPEHYKPLGLEIFKQRIEQRATYLEFLINEDIRLSSGNLTGETKERQLFEIADSEENPYSWDFDLCNIVLGNFNYKKMSLVRDYNQVVDNNIPNTVFNELFNDQPRQLKEKAAGSNLADDWSHVISADPAQSEAILHSRTNESYIIQGPPGTGKSQTITNLIADFISRGKSVMFICEKRAALDVVHHRLKQNGLDELCCYIHDSQSDKREFVKNLKETYEDFSKNKLPLEEIKNQRKAVIKAINDEVNKLKEFHSVNGTETENIGIKVRSLIERIIELRDHRISLSAAEKELLPIYKTWMESHDTIVRLCAELEEAGNEPAFAEHPFNRLNDSILRADDPNNQLQKLIVPARDLLKQIKEALREINIPSDLIVSLKQLKNLIEDAIVLQPIADSGNLKLIDKSNKEAKDFEKVISAHHKLKQAFVKAAEKNQNWINKLCEEELTYSIGIAQKYEKSFFKFLNSEWRRMKRQMSANYDFSKQKVKIPYSVIFGLLKEEYELKAAAEESQNALKQQYHISDIEETNAAIESMRKKIGDKEIDFLIAHPEADNIVRRISKLNDSVQRLESNIRFGLYEGDYSLEEISDHIDNVLANSGSLSQLSHVLKEFASLPEKLKEAVRKISMNPLQAESVIAQKAYDELLRYNKIFAAIDGPAIARSSAIIENNYNRLLHINADYVRASVRQRFISNLELCNTALSQLNAEQKQFKKNYNEGRKILENEFNKSMRYKSIRELSTKESGMILRDIKPVWLMSPLSVSDSLPISNNFDVVIFDEASQITLEEGIPALYRSQQAIIVGDDKQMPPTNFFTAAAEDPDDLETVSSDEDDEILNSDADSLLVQGVRKLNSTMLRWHYRSRSETLISYSNHAFYEAGLLTIPDQSIRHDEKKPIEVSDSFQAANNVDFLYDRSISFHHLTNSIYEKRSNVEEARYIANLVRELLKRNVEESIGIVAFSQEQQQTIEDALSELSKEDKEFEALFEKACQRTENDQFVGLIIKNLENIQGDERDIIIMSVCYGYDAKKRMIMNFGPINKKGGEKRLNVIFSRAKKHMAVISSIKYFDITNEYNTGANYFRRFLQYAESISTGNLDSARVILDSLILNQKRQEISTAGTIVMREIKSQLQKEGFIVNEQVGQSEFKCSLAIRKNIEDDKYCLSILIDDEKHYSATNLVEQYFQRPAILKQFGWKLIRVFARDWLHNRDVVMKQIHNAIEGVVDPLIEAPNSNFPSYESEEIVPEKIPMQTEAIDTTYENVVFERLEFKDEASNKFWEIGVKEDKIIVKFGRIGTKGQLQIKTFADNSKAESQKEKLREEKLNKGYRRV